MFARSDAIVVFLLVKHIFKDLSLVFRFLMYCIITTCSIECYWHCSDGTVH